MTDPLAIGFIGLGAMGLPMASQLAQKLPQGSSLHVFDIANALMESMHQLHPDIIVQGLNAKDVTNKSDIVFIMLPEGRHVKSVFVDGESSVCAGNMKNKIFVDCSTIDVATSVEVKDFIQHKEPSATYYDAPVSGGTVGAQKGAVAFFLGINKDDEIIFRLRRLLAMMGKEIIPCGGSTAGLAAKLSNNYLSGIIAIACSEAMDMGMRSGLDPSVLAKVYAAGTAQNTICDRFCPVPGVQPEAPSSKAYRPGFKVELMRKDFALALEMAERAGARNVLGQAGLQTYDGACDDEKCKGLDSRVVFRFLGGDEAWAENHKRGKE